MRRQWLAMMVRVVATALTGAGVLAFTVGLLGSVIMLMEGMTGLVGEGERLQPESPEQISGRLTFVAALLGVAILGWLLARLSDTYRRAEGRQRPRMTRLAAEVLL